MKTKKQMIELQNEQSDIFTKKVQYLKIGIIRSKNGYLEKRIRTTMRPLRRVNPEDDLC